MAEHAPRVLIDRIAAATTRYPYKVWGFGESIAMEGLLAAGDAPRDFAAALIGRWATTAPPLRTDPLAHVAPGVPLLSLYADTRDPRLLDRAVELADLLTSMTVGCSGARIHRPDLAGWEHEVWVDCIHLDGPFLARLGAITGDGAYADHAADLLLSHVRVLQDDASGFFSHGFDDATGERNKVHWGRGQGWALLGLVDTLRELPASHPARPEIQQRVTGLIDGLAAAEAAPGRWSTVVDRPETYLEPSVSAFLALGVGRAIRASLVASSYQSLADRAWQAVAEQIAPDGTLSGVSNATPVGGTIDHYNARPTGDFPWGQGPALLAAIQRGRDAA